MIRWAAASLLMCSFPAAVLAEEPVRIGFVDLQRAIQETEDGRKAKAKLKKEVDQKQKELDERQEELRKAFDDLQKKRTLLPAETVQQKEMELAKKDLDLKQMFVRHQQDLQTREQEAMTKIFERMNRIIAKIATAENLTVVLEKNQSALLYAKPHLELTNEVIRRYNAGEGGAAGPAEAKPPAPPAKKK